LRQKKKIYKLLPNNFKKGEMRDKILTLIAREKKRQKKMIGLIPSENNFSPEIGKVLGSCLSSKYSEGYPKRRYYEGNQTIDQIETEAIERLKKLFNVPFANVQSYSGSVANSAIQFALLEPGECLMGLKLSSGGHLTHGHPDVTFSGKYFKTVQYGLNQKARIDFKEVEELALRHRPKVIYVGTTAYPFLLDFKKFSEIAEKIGAFLVADISHICGLVAGGVHPSPVPYADVIMSTTHKTFRGPRGSFILVTEKGLKKDPKLGKKIDKAVFPGLQGGPHNATTAGIALAAGEAMTSDFKKYAQNVVENAQVLSDSLKKHGLKMVGNGTQSHLIVLDFSEIGLGLGTVVALALDRAGLYANKNTIPNEPCSAFYPSGLRIGTPLITTRGMKKREMTKIAEWIKRVVDYVKNYSLPEDRIERRAFLKRFKRKIKNDKYLASIREEVENLVEKFPEFKW
jgi:glycine hydroxymethyltransferase